MSIVSLNRHIIINPLNDRVLIYNKHSKKAYSIGKNEYEVLALIDGKRTVEQICERVNHYSSAEVSQLLAQFDSLGFLSGNQTAKNRRLNPLMLKFALAYPKHRPPNAFNTIYTVFIKYMAFPLFLLGVIAFILYGANPRANMIGLPFSVSAASILIAITLHELSHAAVAKKEGAIVAEIGVGLMCCFIPCMYTSIIAVDRIKKKSSRILVYASGMLLNLALIGISILLSMFTSKTLSGCLMVFANLNLFLILINLNFFFKTDAYSILAEIFNDRLLKEHSFSYFIAIFKKGARTLPNIPKSRKRLFLSYAISSILVLLLVVSLCIVALINLIIFLISM